MIIRIYDYNGKGELVKYQMTVNILNLIYLMVVLTYPIQVDACDEPRKWTENEGHYKLTKDKFNKLWHLKRDVFFNISKSHLFSQKQNFQRRRLFSST